VNPTKLILVLKQNDPLCSVYYSQSISSTYNYDQTQNALVFFINCMKIKCEFILPDDSIIPTETNQFNSSHNAQSQKS